MRIDLNEGEIIEMVGNKAYEYERKYHGCAQCTLRSLQECLNLPNGNVIKSATAFCGGIARSGNLCGGLTGGLMAIGLAFGRDVSEMEQGMENPSYIRTREVAFEFYHRFKQEFHGVTCWEVQDKVIGRHFNLNDPEERAAFFTTGAWEAGAEIVSTAAKIAAKIILEAGWDPIRSSK